MQECHVNDKIEPHNHNEYPLLYKEVEILTSSLDRFLECQKCNILVITWALVICLTYVPSVLGPSGPWALGIDTHQANPLCPCYNYYVYYLHLFMICVLTQYTA